jgi:hypothetical protein
MFGIEASEKEMYGCSERFDPVNPDMSVEVPAPVPPARPSPKQIDRPEVKTARSKEMTIILLIYQHQT